MTDFFLLDFAPLLVGNLAAIACALPGTFLLLRRQALIGDAVSHVVLPGIVVAFLLTGAVATWPMMLGAAGAALVAVILIEAIARLGRIEHGAAMGLVFTTMFAGGVLLLEQSDTSGVHLDVEHALYGSLESLIWLAADGAGSLLDPEALAALPPQVWRLAGTVIVIVLLLAVFWKELVISTFDPGYARSLGLPVGAIGFGLTAVTAIAAVAAFDAVGSVIVIAMFVCPPAAARLMSDRLPAQLAWNTGFAMMSATGGHLAAGVLPPALGFGASVSSAGMIAVIAGFLLALAALAGPARRRHATI
ncbi:MAG: metal ABC transporter permease [Rubricella sp.]